MATRLTDMHIDKVALVDNGANQRRFAVLKRDPATGADAKLQKALASGIAKGSGDKPGLLAAIRKAITPAKRRVAKSANDMVSQATWALSYVLELIEDEAASSTADAGSGDAAEDQTDLVTLRQVAQLLGTYITSTAAEVGTPEDLEDVASEAAAYAAAMSSYYPIYMRDGGIAKGHKQFTGSRVTRLAEARDTLAAVLDEIAEIEAEEEESGDSKSSKATKKRATPEEAPMTSDELATITKAIAAQIAPIAADVAVLKAAAQTPLAKGDDEAEDGEVSLADIAKAIGQLADRVQAVETRPGVRKSIDGQDGSEPVKKKSVFAGMF